MLKKSSTFAQFLNFIRMRKLKTYIIKTLLLSVVLLTPLRSWAVGWTPTDAGLVVNLEQGERFLLSVWVDMNDNSEEDPGEELFVSNYNRYSGGYFGYSAGSFMKLLPAQEVTEMNEWSVGAPLARGNKALGGIAYTIWNDGKTLKTSDSFKFLGDLTSDYADAKACDVVFVIPTDRGVPTVDGRDGLSSFDPNGTLGRGKTPFNSRMGTGFLGMTYREVYMFDIPKANSPQSYANAALVTFNTTLGSQTWSAGTITKGKAAYAYADSKHDKTTRTLFRLYLLDDPINSCSSYFFATDEQDYTRYRKNEGNPINKSDSTAFRKIYTMDRMFCMNSADEKNCVQTDYMYVPVPDSTYYYVGHNNDYKDKDKGETMGTNGAHSMFTQIRELPILGLADTLKAPAGAFGRMVADTTSAVDNLNVKFKPAGYFCKISTGTNIPMRPNADSTIWTCEEMWHITDAYAALQIKATMFSGPEYSPTDEGIDIPGWSVFITGNTVPLESDHNQHVTGGMDGWARIYATRSEPNGYMEFILANPRYHIHYDNNGLLGIHVPDQYPEEGHTTVTVEKSRLVNGFNFTGWNTKADGSGTTYQPNDVVNFASLPVGVTLENNDSILTLYAQGSYTGTYYVAFSFEHSNGKRYFLTQPIGETNRYARARPVGDWTDTYQGMSDPYNTEPNYISTYKLIGHPTCVLCEHNETSYEYVLDPHREWRYGAKDSLLFYSNFAPASDVYLGLYYENPETPFKDPVTIVANNSWAGAFTSTSKATTATGWPDYSVADVQNTKLKSTHYFDGFTKGGEIERKERPSKDSSFVYYNETLNQFDGVKTEGEATTFQISRVRVADEHYVVLPDTTKTWRDTIEFAYHNGEQSREQVWTSMIGKQLLAVTKAGNDTVYFHPDPDHIIQDPNNLYLDKNFRVSQVFEFIRDSRVSAVAEEDRALHETTSNHWHNDIVSGLNSPIDVKDGEGNYIDIVDTFRITMSHGGISKIKQYYGRWKKGARGLKVNGDGSVRTRDVIVRTKTYHYGNTITHLVLKPEFKSYIFNPLEGNSQVINFTLAYVTAHRLVDVNGNEVGEEEIIDSEYITPSLALVSGACTFSSGGSYFNISEAVNQHITLATKAVNKEVDNHDTLIISMNVSYGGEVYPVTARVPLVQTSLEGDELIWSVQSGSKRYYIMAGTGGLIFRQYALKDGTLYKEGTQNTALIKGSKDAANSDKQYITPWQFSFPSGSANQLALKTKYGVDRYFHIDDDENKPEVDASDSSLLTFHYVDVLTNDNANEEELVKLQYGADKWLQFTLTGGSGAKLVLVNREEDASVFSWSYLQQEYSLLNNGAYPDRDTVIFGYNTEMSEAVRAPYKAYKEYSMLVGNSMVNCCREQETDMSNLQDGEREWKTRQTFSLIPDARTFDSGSTPSPATSGISRTGSTVSTSGDSPTDVTIGGKYVNIVDTLQVTLSLREGAPAYRFKGDWSGFRSVSDAELKIPLIRKTYHEANYDSLVCVIGDDAYNHTFPNTITDPVSYTFNLGTKNRTGRHVLDVANTTIEVLDRDETDVTVSGGMNLNSTAMAEVLLLDDYGNTPSWCRISGKTATTITVECTQSGIRTPRMAYIRIFYIIVISDKMYVVTEQLTVSQPSYFQYANNQHLVHSSGASGDPLRADGMQQVHENKRILYYYPEQDVELPIRDSHFFGWWRWFREGDGEIGDSDIPESSWRKQPSNTGSGRSGSYNFPFRIIGDSVKVWDEEKHDSVKVLMTMGRYTVFHYKAADYNDNKKNPPVKVARVAPPITTYGEAEKPTVTYAAEISNYYDNLPMSLSHKNQVDTAMMDTMTAIPEPTLSLREIFELHPWTEMAARLDGFKTEIPSGEGDHTTKVFPLANESYMEDHVMMAPLGNELLLSTEQRYILEHLQTTKQSESLLGYYMRDDHWSDGGWDAERKDTMIFCGGWDATCKWYTYNPKTQKYSVCNHSTTVSDDFLKVPKKENITNGQEFDTVYYCLRAQSQSTTGTPGVNETTVDGKYMFNICRYKLIYHKPGKYGPLAETKDKAGNTKALITNDDIEQHYEVLERLNFDYNQPGPEYTIYPHPLPWADASYGYTYPETPDLPHNRLHAHSDFPNHGEYGLINRIPTVDHWGEGVTSYWRPMEQHGGASNGYMIYCDGMSSSGQVAALSLETHLCSGQKMFFSGYVCNPSSQTGKADPNFIFSVQGSVNGTDWDDITSYTTGGIKPSSQWSQIYFPIVFDENIDYQHFRVRIYNVSSDWDGNDFIIDDMCIFATKPPLIAYQANTACKEKADEELPSHVILRVDYQGIVGDGYNDTTVYYTLKSVNSEQVVTYVHMIDGYLEEEIHHDTICGKLYIPGKTYEPTHPDSIFVNMNQLIDTFDVSSQKHAKDAGYKIFKEGYIYEILEGDIRPVKYVIHSAHVNAIDTFTVHMSGAYKDMLSSLCGMTSHLKVSNQMVLELNGEELPANESLDLCANSTYDIGLRVKGSLYLDSVAPINLNGTCVNDWLLYGDTADLTGSPKRRYGYKYSDIVKVVKDILRCDPPGTENANQFAPNMAAVSRNEMQRIKDAQSVTLDTTAHPYDILADLVDKGFLTLYKPKMTATVYAGDSVQYVIFPILGTGTDTKQHSSVEVCPMPMLIKLKPQSSSAIPLIVGGLNRDSSEMELPVVVLADMDMANQEITLKVDSIMPRIGIASVKLRATDDPDFQEGFHKLDLVPDLDYPQTEYYLKGHYITLQPASSNNYTMKQGYNYTFAIDLQTILGKDTLDGGCKVGTVPFTLAVVPSYLRWDPQDSIGSQWNKHGNWMGIDQYNQPMHATARFAPLATTSVIIPAMTDGRPYPELPDLTDPATYDSVKQVGFQYNQCDYIRFLPGAAISQQQRMNYTDAVVDMDMPQQKWAFRSAPVAGMLSGDIFMANADLNETTPLWEVGEFDAAGRSHKTGNGSFWLSLYSRTTYKQMEDSVDNRLATADWSKVTNGVNLSLPAGQGFAVYARTQSGKGAVVRLPKHDDIYYYYDQYGNKLYDYYVNNLCTFRDTEAGSRTAGKLAFHGDSEDYTIENDNSVETEEFVFGNPTMGYIDIWGFINDNCLEEEFHYMDEGGEASEYREVTKASIGAKDTISDLTRYLPPMRSIMVKKSSATASHTVTLNANRIVTDASQISRPLVSPCGGGGDQGKAQTPKRSKAVVRKGIMTITAQNPCSPRCTSHLLLGQGYDAAIRSGEDALLTTVNIDNFSMTSTPTTPFNLYAIEDSCGLSIDLRDEIVNVPLSFYMSDLPYDAVTHLWFTGVNNIDGPLVLYDALLGTERAIIDGICIDIETPQISHQKRYYIRRLVMTPEDDPEPGTATGTGNTNYNDEKAIKIVHNGHVYIVRNGHVYTMMGQRIR